MADDMFEFEGKGCALPGSDSETWGERGVVLQMNVLDAALKTPRRDEDAGRHAAKILQAAIEDSGAPKFLSSATISRARKLIEAAKRAFPVPVSVAGGGAKLAFQAMKR